MDQATMSLFLNPDSVEDTQAASKTLMLATNARVGRSSQEAVVPRFGKVCFNQRDAIASIFGFSVLKKRHWITCDSNKEDAFVARVLGEQNHQVRMQP